MTRVLLGLALAILGGPARGGAPVAWTAEENVSQTSTDTETGLNHRPLAVTADGTLHVAWAERDSPNQQYRIWARRLGEVGWSAPELVVDYPATDPGDPGDDIGAKYPALAATPDGELHLFWHDYRVAGIANIEIFTKTRPAGGEWDSSRAADVRLTTTNHPEALGDNGYVPVPVAASDGALHVVWWDYRFDGDRAEILAKTRPAGGAWDLTPGDSADVRVTTDTDHSELPAVAVDLAGRVHVAWRGVAAGASILYAERDPGGSWSAPVDIDLGGLVQGAPALALDGNAAVHVVWPDARSGGRALYARARVSGTWDPSVERITSPAHGADEPSLTSDGDGALHLVWSDARHGFFDREIFHRTKPLGAPWDTAAANDFRVSNADGNSTRPSVLAHGAIVSIVWKDERTGNHDLWIRRGGPSGTHAPIALPAERSWLAFPNPTRGTVRLLGPSDAACELVVLDVSGRAVRRLSGSGEIAWDGRDAGGRSVPGGVYFVHEAAARRAIR
ncbi:MAG: hypothetical protein ACRDGR_10135, partial [bacterium]